ncbi:hypothetical protein [Halorussus amylolyticus]|uniref:hypothetical protein n=1 Tax=Halorussus amylolyticus TaxID=1126242 RepID=UPI0010455526|nr:hypothetical protein [Halorussus amylolyticus]
MTGFLIQASGHPIEEQAAPAYIAGANGPRFCDEPLRHGEYFNASPFWKREGFGRYDAWQTLTSGDEGLLYCTSSVDEHGACLSHLLTVNEVHRDDEEGARLEFSAVRELIPKVPYSDIQTEIAVGRLSEQMKYCGQEGFNITLIPESDVSRVLELTMPEDANSTVTTSHPNESLEEIAEDYFGSS